MSKQRNEGWRKQRRDGEQSLKELNDQVRAIQQLWLMGWMDGWDGAAQGAGATVAQTPLLTIQWRSQNRSDEAGFSITVAVVTVEV